MVFDRLSDNEKGRILQAYLDGKSMSAIATDLGRNKATVSCILMRYKKFGNMETKKSLGKREKLQKEKID